MQLRQLEEGTLSQQQVEQVGGQPQDQLQPQQLQYQRVHQLHLVRVINKCQRMIQNF